MKTVCVLLTTFALTSYTPIPSTELSTEELKTLYQNYYLASNVDGIDWTSKGGSDPGQIPKEIYEKV